MRLIDVHEVEKFYDGMVYDHPELGVGCHFSAEDVKSNLWNIPTENVLRFSEQDEVKRSTINFDAGYVQEYEEDGNKLYVIEWIQSGAEKTFSIGQPVFNSKGDQMGVLGIYILGNDYWEKYHIAGLTVMDAWIICMPTKHCKAGEKVYTYWQNKEREDGI